MNRSFLGYSILELRSPPQPTQPSGPDRHWRQFLWLCLRLGRRRVPWWERACRVLRDPSQAGGVRDEG